MTGATLLGVMAALAGVGLAFSSGLLISRAALRPEVFLSLILLVTTVRALGLGRAGLRYVERLASHGAALRASQQLRVMLFDTVSRFGRDLLALERSGDLLARAGADVDARQFYALRVTLPLWALAGVVAVWAAGLAMLDPGLALLATLPLLGAAWATWQVRARAAALAREELAATQQHAAGLLDALAASADGAARHHAPALESLGQTLKRVANEVATLSGRLSLIREFAFGAAVTGVLWHGAALVMTGELSGALLAAVTLGTAAAFDALTPLPAVPGAHAVNAVAVNRAAALAAVTPAVQAPPVPLACPAGPVSLELRGVALRRGGRVVLDGVSLTLRAGDWVSLGGPSGAGKTTLARLLTRDLDPDAGQVTLGGMDVRDLDLPGLRAYFSVHEQDAPLLDGTLRENLQLGDHHAPDARLRGLLDALGLFHLSLDSWVGEGGMRLSGGERARVSLARALLRPSHLVILDEPTAHLDAETERQVLAVIERELVGRALLLITHRIAPQALTRRHLTLRAGHLSEAALHDTRTDI